MVRKTNLVLFGVVLFIAGAGLGKLLNQPANAHSAIGRVLKLEELSFTDIDKLDRAKSIFFLTFGNLEEHGPHLPVGADYFQAVAVRDGLIARLRASHSDYDFVIAPVVPLGEGGANVMALQLDHVGTFDVRYETLRNVAIDLGTTIARKGFQNIFLIHSHGARLHNVAFSEAAAFVSEEYKTRMVNITSLVFGEGIFSAKVMDKHLGEGWGKKIGFENHAGAAETSSILFLRGDLVKPDYKRIQPFIAKDRAEFLRTYQRAGWNGYWGDPAKASKAMGKELIDDFVERSLGIAEKALAGEDLSKLPVYPDVLPVSPEAEIIGKKVEEHYAEQTAAVVAWLKKRRSGKRYSEAGGQFRSEDEEAIKKICLERVETFNRHEAPRATDFTSDADFVTAYGMWWKSPAEIASRQGEAMKTVLKDAKLTLLDLRIRFVRPDVAIVHLTHEMSGMLSPDGQKIPPHRERGIRVMVREQGKWLTTAFHNTRVSDVEAPSK